jgi:hypothetical protein
MFGNLKMIEELAKIGVNEGEIPYFRLIVGNPELGQGINLHDYVGLAQKLKSTGEGKRIEGRIGNQRLSHQELTSFFGSLRRNFDALLQRNSCEEGMSPFEILLMSEYLGRRKQKRTSGNITLHSSDRNYAISENPLGDFSYERGDGIVGEAALIDYLNLAGPEAKNRVLDSPDAPRLIDIYQDIPIPTGSIPFSRTLQLRHLEGDKGTSFSDEDSMEKVGIPREYYREYIRKYRSVDGCYDANGAVQKLLWPVAKSLGIKTTR